MTKSGRAERPLTAAQRTALHWMSKKPLTYTVAGYNCALRPFDYWHSQTIGSLEQRSFCTIKGSGMSRVARITTVGRRQLGGSIR